ncbi:MAG: hypothetical protein BHV78_00735 [Bacteroides sp. CAG:1060_57_27]|nr:MAG: hypothetical protein BHV78_00735 [Bacteroides sp. CAG:1060_57_27]
MSDGVKDIRWYAMSLLYVQAAKVAPALEGAGFECFVPPVVRNIMFIHDSRERIAEFMKFDSRGARLIFMRSRSDGQPIVVRDSAMQDFISICRVYSCPIVMTRRPELKLGAHVRVKEGPLAGIEGHVVRIRKSRCVLVNVDNVLWAATEFINPDMLEVLDEEPDAGSETKL